MRNRITASLVLAATTLAACDSSPAGTSSGGARVALNFTASTGAAVSVAPAQRGLAPSAPARQLSLSGDNGVLTLTDLRVVVARFRLKGDDDVNRCTGNDCDDFNAGPLFIQLPLSGVVTVDAGRVRPGTYEDAEFRVKNLDDDDDLSDDDAAETARTRALLQQIRAQVPNWPDKASMMVTGTFQPVGGTAQPFRVFVRAELRARVPLSPPLVVTDASPAPQVTITVDPAVLFRSGTRVVDLAAVNGRLIELRADNAFRGTSSGGRR
jgi:hypothetical protein